MIDDSLEIETPQKGTKLKMQVNIPDKGTDLIMGFLNLSKAKVEKEEQKGEEIKDEEEKKEPAQ